MKKFAHKLISILLILTFLIPYSVSLPAYADDNAKPDVYLMQYSDEFESTEANERIELGTSAVYGNGSVKTGGVANSSFKIYLNRNKCGAFGNVVTEFTIKQSGLMTYGGQGQILLYSSASERVGDLRWRKLNNTSQDLYINGTTKESITFDENKSEIKLTIQYNTVTKEFSLWVDDEKKIDNSTTHTYASGGDLSYVYFNSNSQMTLSVDNFKWYYAESEDDNLPKVKDTIYHEDFEADNATPSSSDRITLENTSKISYVQEKGVIRSSTDVTGGVYATVFNLLDEKGAKPIGEYVVETVLNNPTGTENYHRLIFGDAMFIEWNTQLNKDKLSIDNFVPSRKTTILNASDFATTGNVLKVTAKFNTEEATVDIWINNKLAWSHNYREAGCAESDCLKGTSHSSVKTWLFNGSLEISDFHYYVPVEKQLTGDEIIDKAYGALNENVIYPLPLTANGYLADDLYLPTVGEKGANISWSVSDNAKNIVDVTTGAVNRAQEETNVTLTATLSADGGTSRTKDFNLKVPALGDTPDNLPAMLDIQSREHFNEYNDKTMVLSPSAVGSMDVNNGKLNIKINQKTASANNAVVYLSEDKRDINGEFGVEFIMERASGTNGMQIFLASDSVKTYSCDVRWNTNEVQLGTGWNGSRYMTSELFKFADYDIGKTLKITLLLNTEAQEDGLGRLTLLLNNKFAATTPVSSGPVSLIKFARDNAIVDLTIDNLRFYYLKTNDANAARLDAAELNYNDIFKPAEVDDKLIAYDLELPTKGVRGSQFEWSSSNPEIISNKGKVTRPEEDTEVTLTAKAICGEAEYSVQFKITVLRGGDGDLVLLKKDMDALTLESILTGDLTSTDLISDDLILYTKGKYGSTITWSTSNSSLITTEGKVTRPANQEGNIYVILTAEFKNGNFTLSKEFRLGIIPETYSASNIPLPERYEDVLNSDFKVHTDGGEKYNSDLVGFSYNIGGWSGCLCRGWGGKITEENGYVEMVRDRSHKDDGSALDSTYFQYALSPLGVGIGDLAAIQYTLTKKGEGEVHQKINGKTPTSYNNLVLIYWQKDGTFKFRHKTEDGKDKDTYTTKAYTGSVQITVMTDENAGTFSLWLNDECVLYQVRPYNGNSASLYRVDSSIEGTNFLTLEISSYDVYKVYPLDHLRPVQDSALLTENVIRDGIYNPSPGRLSSDLKLPNTSRYGSTISWTSTHPEIIDSIGILNRPLDLSEEVEVTITAKVEYGCFSVLKDFTFFVQPCYSEDVNTAQKDHDFMSVENWNLLSFNDTSFDHVTTSLNLLDKGPYGSTYYWKSSNTSVITNSGRVIRPRWNESAKVVEVTLVTAYGSATKTKTFTFTVIPEEELKDPKHMSDEDFFGVWNNESSSWTTESKFNYKNYPELSKVEAAAKAGNYELAKIELLNYMKQRPKSFVVSSISRNTSYAEAFTMSNIYDSENHSHYAALGAVKSHDYQEVSMDLSGSIIKGSVTSYKVSARYNEKSTVKVLSSEYHSSDMRPRAELVVNGSRKVFYACGDTTISGGNNRFTNFSDQDEMPITYFGPFQNEGLSDMLLQFDFSSIKEGDNVSEAYLYFYAKIDEAYAPSKEIVITRSGTDWDASTVTLDNIEEYTFNYNGNPGKNTWRKPGNAESEYILQASRMSNPTAALAEYVYTGNEKYAYAVIYDIMDFIIDTQGRFVYAEELAAGRVPSSMDWEKVKDRYIVRYGAYPRALDSALRQKSLINMFDILTTSQYMSADICTAILKNLWHSSVEVEKFLVHPDSQDQGANQKIIEAECFSTTAAFMPEFTVSDYLVGSSIPVMETLLANSFYPDGSYIEGSDGYTGLALGQFNTYWEKILIMGKNFSDGAIELLGKANQYVANLASNGGVSIAWGDNGKSTTRISMRGQDYYKLSKDEETNFIYTYGRAGAMPSWTSRLYEGNMLAVMRSDWTDEGTYVFMPSGSLYPHAHYDANQIILNAYKKAMLIDPGYYSYSASPERTYVKSTLGHNTVEIDNTSQRLGPNVESTNAVPLATKHSWVSNSNYDFYSVSNYSNKAQAVDDLNNCIEHRRTVTFIKPNIVIVSDLMSPDMEDDAEASKPHSYKQLWHMSSLADMRSKESDKLFYSNFPSGAQIKIASADSDVSMNIDVGIDTEAWGVGSEAKYGYYKKENLAGKVTFDTVLLPYKLQGDVKAEHISLGDGVETSDATAMKIYTEVDGEANYIYYMLDYDHIDNAVHTFAGYTTDAELALVRTNKDGEIIETIIYNGSYINETSGETILSAGAKAESLSLTIENGSGEFYASEDVVMENIRFSQDIKLKNTRYNDKTVEINNQSGAVVPSDKEENKTEETDRGNDKGGITDGKKPGASQGGAGGSVGGGSVGGGSVGGGSVGGGSVGGGTTVQNTFNDIETHWAKDSITRMAAKGIVQGDGKNFNPDSNISRAELVTMAVRALGLNTTETNTPYADVAADSWYAKYINAALNVGIISTDANFRPNDLITREEMSKILSGVNALLSGGDLIVPDTYTTSFTDATDISSWAEAFIKYASYKGLMNGTEGGRFAPKESATRAQVATVIDRMFSSK